MDNRLLATIEPASARGAAAFERKPTLTDRELIKAAELSEATLFLQIAYVAGYVAARKLFMAHPESFPQVLDAVNADAHARGDFLPVRSQEGWGPGGGRLRDDPGALIRYQDAQRLKNANGELDADG